MTIWFYIWQAYLFYLFELRNIRLEKKCEMFRWLGSPVNALLKGVGWWDISKKSYELNVYHNLETYVRIYFIGDVISLLVGEVYLWNNTLFFHMYHKVVSCLTLTFITTLITWYILICVFRLWFRRHVVKTFYQVTAASFQRRPICVHSTNQ